MAILRETPRINYRAGYKYQLLDDCVAWTGIVRPGLTVADAFLTLRDDGLLIIRSGYAWDGPSGPAIDTPNFMRGSLVHDALYQLMREKRLDHDTYRDKADRLLQKHCKEDGMSSLRAWWVYWGVRLGGGPSADPHRERRPLTAP